MTTNTLRLMEEFLMQGGEARGVDADELACEVALVAAAPRLKTALSAMVINYAAFGRVTDHFVQDCARLLQEVEA